MIRGCNTIISNRNCFVTTRKTWKLWCKLTFWLILPLSFAHLKLKFFLVGCCVDLGCGLGAQQGGIPSIGADFNSNPPQDGPLIISPFLLIHIPLLSFWFAQFLVYCCVLDGADCFKWPKAAAFSQPKWQAPFPLPFSISTTCEASYDLSSSSYSLISFLHFSLCDSWFIVISSNQKQQIMWSVLQS